MRFFVFVLFPILVDNLRLDAVPALDSAFLEKGFGFGEYTEADVRLFPSPGTVHPCRKRGVSLFLIW